ncbi:UNVERIFIED_CONTAM: hypothetical protein Slati_2402100 [Sesamum latifolium]|uniref:Uncharacterized protein n=1 Tax=Sesamum latifolium TaxID=2727402 RepID=A0AAW2WD35_9LAMI
MEPNKSPSYDDNRDYFQIPEIQRKELLMEVLEKCCNSPQRTESDLLMEEVEEKMRAFPSPTGTTKKCGEAFTLHRGP